MSTKQELGGGVFEFADYLAKLIALAVISILMVLLYLKSLSKSLSWPALQNKAVSLWSYFQHHKDNAHHLPQQCEDKSKWILFTTLKLNFQARVWQVETGICNIPT